jgi:hypothetical protein
MGSTFVDARLFFQNSTPTPQTTMAITTAIPITQPMLELTVSDVRAWLPAPIGGSGGGGGDEATGGLAPQSAQSVAYPQVASVEPEAPSLHTPSLAKKQVLVHT